MKKTIITLVVAITLIIAGVSTMALSLVKKDTAADTTSQSAKKTQSTTPAPYGSISACDILTEKIAKSLLGSTATKVSAPDSASIKNAPVGISNCSYLAQDLTAKTTSPKASGTSLLVQYANNADGAAANRAQFEDSLSGTEVQRVSDLGDAAFYSPQFRQLNVLKGNNWYIITYYKDSITNGSLATSSELARKLQLK